MEIRIENLTKTYGDFNAVDKMNLHVQDGELVGLLGPSGCGKSTTLFMLAGLSEPTEGKIYFGDKDVTKIAPENREIGLVFQNYALYPHMTVEENIMFPLLNRKMKKKEARERAFDMAKLVQLDGLMNRKPKALSGGQQQRVAIARALVKKPQVLLLDEPLSNLDAKLRVETREEIRRIQQEVGITTIFVTHDQEEAMSISDKIAIMNKGVIQQYEIPQQMYLNPDNLFVAQFLGVPQINSFQVTVQEGNIYCGAILLRSGCNLPDGQYTAGIRPETFQIVEENGIDIEVSQVRMTGRELLVFFRLGEENCRMLVQSDLKINTGCHLQIAARPKQILLFGQDGTSLGKY